MGIADSDLGVPAHLRLKKGVRPNDLSAAISSNDTSVIEEKLRRQFDLSSMLMMLSSRSNRRCLRSDREGVVAALWEEEAAEERLLEPELNAGLISVAEAVLMLLRAAPEDALYSNYSCDHSTIALNSQK